MFCVCFGCVFVFSVCFACVLGVCFGCVFVVFCIRKPPDFLNEGANYIEVMQEGIFIIRDSGKSIELNEKDGYIEVLASDKDAFISTQLVTLVTKNLQSRIISLRTNKIKEQLEYSKEQYEQKKVEFEILQNNLAEFKDSNKNISTAVFLAELQKLESEYQLQENILVSLASEYNENKIKLNKDTPIFSVLDDVSVPNERSKPNRKLIVLIFIIIGLFISISYVIIREPIIELFKYLKEN